MSSVVADEPTLADVFGAMWAARMRVLTGVILGLAAAFLLLLFAAPQYRISMLVAPAERTAQADIKALLPDNPGFALQYLVNAAGTQDSADFTRFEYVLRGPAVAARIDAEDRERVVAGMGQVCKFRLGCAPNRDSSAALAELFQKTIRIEPVGNTKLRRIVFDHPSGAFGVWLLERLYEDADRLIRAEVAERAHRRADYLKSVLAKTSHPDHRRALTSLLMEQEHILMILAMDEPFAAIVAEPPIVSVRPVWPSRALIFAGFAFAGAFLGFALSRTKYAA